MIDMTDAKRSNPSFPKRFLWGAAISAHQTEGGLNNQWTAWELENAKKLATQAPYSFGRTAMWSHVEKEATNPDNYVSGTGVEHYSRYEEDFQLLEQMGLNSFRFGIEWARVEPEEGAWDASVIDHYRTYLKRLKELEITPVVTLFHFTLPVWFAEKGGFERRSNVAYFVRFVEKIFDELGRDLEWIISINEPLVYVGESYFQGVWPPNQTKKLLGFKVLMNLIRAHKKVYQLACKNRRHKVSMAHNLSYIYAGDDAWVSRLSARAADYLVNQWIVRRVRKHSNFLAINYYFAQRFFGYRVHNSEKNPESDLGWDMQPDKLYELLIETYRKHQLPIFITENGLADATDQHRKWWLMETIRAMDRALKEDVKIIGYLHWSLLDNFEWDKGYWPKFGLAKVDRKTMERTLRASGKWYGMVVKRLRS